MRTQILELVLAAFMSYDMALIDYTPDGIPLMVTLWKPTGEELEALNPGGLVQLQILGTEHPPVWVGVQLQEQ